MRKDYSLQIGQRIAIQSKKECQFIDISQITHINRKDEAVTTYTFDSNITASMHLKEFEEELSQLGFVRINRTTIVNLAHIKTYTKGEKKAIELTNGETFVVSRRKAHLFK